MATSSGKKAAVTGKRRAVAKKAGATRKRRAAAKKAAVTRTRGRGGQEGRGNKKAEGGRAEGFGDAEAARRSKEGGGDEKRTAHSVLSSSPGSYGYLESTKLTSPVGSGTASRTKGGHLGSAPAGRRSSRIARPWSLSTCRMRRGQMLLDSSVPGFMGARFPRLFDREPETRCGL
jgi:hypothetical protein